MAYTNEDCKREVLSGCFPDERLSRLSPEPIEAHLEQAKRQPPRGDSQANDSTD